MSDRLEAVLGGGAFATVFDVVFNSAELMLTLGEVLFVPLSVVFGSVAPNVEWVSQATLEPVVVVLATFYAANILFARIQQYRQDNND